MGKHGRSNCGLNERKKFLDAILGVYIAGQGHSDRHRPAAGVKQWMALAVNIQLEQLLHTQLHRITPLMTHLPEHGTFPTLVLGFANGGGDNFFFFF